MMQGTQYRHLRDKEPTAALGTLAGSISDPSAGCQVVITAACSDRLTSAAMGKLNAALDEPERFRLASLKCDDARRQYLVTHVLLRATLSALYPVELAEWRFARTTWGQPVIHLPPNVTPLFFSLSHTKSLAVCAVTSLYRVGVDVECIEANIGLADLTRYVFTEEEQQWWQNQALSVRQRRFYELWTLKEALFKAVGRGLDLSPSSVGFRLSPGVPPEILQLPAELGHLDRWSFRIFEPTTEHICALAVDTPATKPLRETWRWVSIETLVECVGGVRATASLIAPSFVG